MIVLADTDKASPPTALIVTGTGRSGTTAVAKLCGFLGVRMVTQADNMASQSYCEHGLVRESVKARRTEVLDRVIAEMDGKLWGFKVPGEFAHCEFAARHLDPQGVCVICVTRDTAATAMCECKFHDVQIKHWLIEYANRNNRLINECCSLASDVPLAIVSYEKLTADPESVSNQIADFICVDRDPQAHLKMLEEKPNYYRVLEQRWTEQSLQL